eukprot:8787232-Pyramimonas_sp.AAC.2
MFGEFGRNIGEFGQTCDNNLFYRGSKDGSTSPRVQTLVFQENARGVECPQQRALGEQGEVGLGTDSRRP